MRQHVKIGITAVALGLLAVAGASQASAQSPDLITSTTIYAAVKANGTIAASNGVVSSANLAPGLYEVIFDRNITTCAFVGTIGTSATSGTVQPGQIEVVGRGGTTTGVFVQVQNSAGTLTNKAYMLSVYCP
jgi:hypothetical protein